MNHVTKYRPTRIFVHGIVVAIVAAVALAGHCAGVPELASWFGIVPMSIPAAFCFLLLGASDIEIALDGRVWNRADPAAAASDAPTTTPAQHA